MKTRKHRHLVLSKSASGFASVMICRFVFRNETMIHSSIAHYNLTRLEDVARIDTMLNLYPGLGVRVTLNEERTLVSQIWEDLDLWDGRVLERRHYPNMRLLVLGIPLFASKATV